VNPDRNIVYNQNSKQDCNVETSNVFGDSGLEDYITNSRADSNEVDNNNNNNHLINNVDNINTNQYNLNLNGDGNSNSSNH
jgi:hypothetical protein